MYGPRDRMPGGVAEFISMLMDRGGTKEKNERGSKPKFKPRPLSEHRYSWKEKEKGRAGEKLRNLQVRTRGRTH